MRAAIAGIMLVVLIGAARPAAADGGAIYDDVRGVIEDVIQAELTKSVVRVIRAKSPGLAFYFRRSLSRLASPYWGNLVASLRDDLGDLVGDFVLWDLYAAPDAGDLPASLGQFFGCLAASSTDAACQELRAIVVTRQDTLVHAHCGAVEEGGGAPELRVACDLALATRAGLARQTAMATRHVIDGVADLLLYDITDATELRALRQVGLGWLRQPETFPAHFADLFVDRGVDPARLDLAAVHSLCQDPEAYAELFDGSPAAGAWVCFAVSDAALRDAMKFHVVIDKGGKPLDAALDFWEVEALLKRVDSNADDPRGREQILYDAFVDQAARTLCAKKASLQLPAVAPPPPPPVAQPATQGAAKRPHRGKPAIPTVPAPPPTPLAAEPWLRCRDWRVAGRDLGGVDVTVEWLGQKYEARLDAGRFKAVEPVAFARAIKRFEQTMARIQEMREAVPPELDRVLFVPDIVPAEKAVPALRAFLRLGTLVAELKSRWYLWPDAHDLADADRLAAIDLGGLLTLALEVARQGQASTGQAAARVRTALAGGNGALGRVFALAFKADYRELAVESLRAALGMNRGSAELRPHETFFISLAAYMLDDPGEVSVGVTRGAFRAAAKDLIATLADTGVPSTKHRLRGSLLPRLALGVAFGDSYRGESQRDGQRTGVAAPWPTAMLALADYVGVDVALLDPVAPLAELALRQVGSYGDESLVALDAVRPRLGVWIALPQLSRNLCLSLGAGARLIALEPAADSTMAAFHGRYVRKASLTLDLGLAFVF